MIKKIIIALSLSTISLFAMKSEVIQNLDEIKLKNGEYIITNQNKLFSFNKQKDNFVAFKLENNLIYNDNFHTGIKIENNTLILYDTYNIFTQEYGKVYEKWKIEDYQGIMETNNTCYKLINKQYNLLLCTN